MCVYTTTDPPGIRLFLRLPASRTSPDTRPLSKEERWHWSHSGVKVTFIHRTWRSHRLPHTPIYISALFLLSIHTTFCCLVFSSLISICLSLLFFPCFFPLLIWAFTSCWNVDPLLDQSCFVRDFLIMGLTEDIWVIQNFTILVPMRWVQSYLHFWFACVSMDLFSLLNSIEKVKSFGWTCSLKSWSAEGITWMWSDHKHWLQRTKTEDTSACLWTFYQRVWHEEQDMFKYFLNAFLG